MSAFRSVLGVLCVGKKLRLARRTEMVFCHHLSRGPGSSATLRTSVSDIIHHIRSDLRVTGGAAHECRPDACTYSSKHDAWWLSVQCLK